MGKLIINLFANYYQRYLDMSGISIVNGMIMNQSSCFQDDSKTQNVTDLKVHLLRN